jgi:TetR/AcrR family transcriptional regulator, repressor for uid operon
VAADSNALSDAYPSRTRSRLETRGRVFEAALAEFRRVGVGPAQIEDIVRAAGVARGTFYLHFPTKDHVLFEVLRRSEGGVAEQLDAALDRSPAEFLRLTVALMAQVATGEDAAIIPDVLAMIARSENRLADSDVALVRVVTQFLTLAQERGEVRRDAPAAELASIFLSGVFGVLLSKTGEQVRGLRPALDRAADVFVRGFAA